MGKAGLGGRLVRTSAKVCSWVGAEKVLASLTRREKAVGLGSLWHSSLECPRWVRKNGYDLVG